MITRLDRLLSESSTDSIELNELMDMTVYLTDKLAETANDIKQWADSDGVGEGMVDKAFGHVIIYYHILSDVRDSYYRIEEWTRKRTNDRKLFRHMERIKGNIRILAR